MFGARDRLSVRAAYGWHGIRLRFDHPLEDRTMPLRSSRVDLKLAFGSGRLWDDASAAIIGLRSLAQRELPPIHLIFDHSDQILEIQNDSLKIMLRENKQTVKSEDINQIKTAYRKNNQSQFDQLFAILANIDAN